MEVIVDGVIYRSEASGGISRLFSEILPRMCEIEASLRIKLLMSGQPRQALPSHPQIVNLSLPQIERFLRPGRLWRHLTPQLKEAVKKTLLGRTKHKIWHSTYFTMPTRWDGAQVVTVHDMIYELFPHLFASDGAERFREQKKRCILAADAVICVSETTKKDLCDFYGLPPGKIWVVPHGYTETFGCLENDGENKWQVVPRPFLLYVGDRAHYKAFDTLVKAYSIWPHRKEVDLVVVGRDWSTSEVNHLAELGIFQQVRLLQDIGDEALCGLYNTAVALVYPSLYEGFGIPLLEAMACGCPIVASRIPSTVEVAGDVPIYFEPGKADDLSVALGRAILEGRKSQRTFMGLRHVRQYSWGKAAEQTLEVYRSLSR